MSFPIASIAVVNSVLFGVYSNTLLALTATSHHERRLQPPSYTHVFIAGCTGGFLQAYCLAPFDLIKVRLQNQTEPRARQGGPPPRYRGPVHCAASIFQEEGPRGLFRGAWALTLRDTPTLGIYFVSYEWLCRQVTPDGQNPSSTTVLVAGGFAGITSWVTATPLDVIKSRMQMAGLGQREYQGLLDCMLRVPPPLVGMRLHRRRPQLPRWDGPPPTCPGRRPSGKHQVEISMRESQPSCRGTARPGRCRWGWEVVRSRPRPRPNSFVNSYLKRWCWRHPGHPVTLPSTCLAANSPLDSRAAPSAASHPISFPTSSPVTRVAFTPPAVHILQRLPPPPGKSPNSTPPAGAPPSASSLSLSSLGSPALPQHKLRPSSPPAWKV
ncbi:solute carrier family 25 member 45 isoform X2 [Myotis yumanensis]